MASALDLVGVLALLTSLLLGVFLSITVTVVRAEADDSVPVQLSRAVHVRAVYPVVIGAAGEALTTRYTLCGPLVARPSDSSGTHSGSSPASGGHSSSAASSVQWTGTPGSAWCGNRTNTLTARTAFTVQQHVAWSSVLPPGVYPVVSEAAAAMTNLSTADLFYSCAVYSCDMQNQLPPLEDLEAAVDRLVRLPAAVGGLSAATPCCGTTNTTFILFPSAPSLTALTAPDTEPPTVATMVQTDVLPVRLLANLSQSLLNEVHCSAEAPSDACRRSSSNSSSNGDSDRSSAAADHLTAPASVCLLRLQNPRFTSMQSAVSGYYGDGGLSFPVSVSICGTDVSDVISTSSAQLLRRGYDVIITVRHFANEAAFPDELIRSVALWVTAERGATKRSLRDSTRCEWLLDPSAASFYRTGNYLSCDLDESLVGRLPPLTLTVSPGVVLYATNSDLISAGRYDSTVPCAISVDLNRLVQRVNVTAQGAQTLRHRLVIYSTGSITDAFAAPSLVRFREPYIVLGANFLQGSTLATSRVVTSKSSTAATEAALRGLPVLFLASLNAPDHPALHAGASAVCVAPLSCELGYHYYPSVNICADTSCIGVFSFSFDPETMRCSLRPVMVALFAVFAALLIASDALLVWLGRWAERQRHAHVKLVEQVQRKKS